MSSLSQDILKKNDNIKVVHMAPVMSGPPNNIHSCSLTIIVTMTENNSLSTGQQNEIIKIAEKTVGKKIEECKVRIETQNASTALNPELVALIKRAGQKEIIAKKPMDLLREANSAICTAVLKSELLQAFEKVDFLLYANLTAKLAATEQAADVIIAMIIEGLSKKAAQCDNYVKALPKNASPTDHLITIKSLSIYIENATNIKVCLQELKARLVEVKELLEPLSDSSFIELFRVNKSDYLAKFGNQISFFEKSIPDIDANLAHVKCRIATLKKYYFHAAGFREEGKIDKLDDFRNLCHRRLIESFEEQKANIEKKYSAISEMAHDKTDEYHLETEMAKFMLPASSRIKQAAERVTGKSDAKGKNKRRKRRKKKTGLGAGLGAGATETRAGNGDGDDQAQLDDDEGWIEVKSKKSKRKPRRSGR